jgi:flagellar hook-length control protein FliK
MDAMKQTEPETEKTAESATQQTVPETEQTTEPVVQQTMSEQDAEQTAAQTAQQQQREVVVEDRRPAKQEESHPKTEPEEATAPEENEEPVELPEGAGQSGKNGSFASGKHESQDFSQHLAGSVNEQAAQFAGVAEAESTAEVPEYTTIDTQDIIEQIVEQTKVILDTESTTIEMQLNPENLGKIFLNISSKEGSVNAQLYAQNEAVKAALEAQIATLTENLNQAGVKVNAIEVSVATHEFERNLEQNAKGDEEQGERREERRFARRSLRMDSLDELSGLMTEEEALVAQMMRDNGNSVDFTA